MLIFDCEIKMAIPTREPKYYGIKYCDGWHDYAGMGISCVCAYDTDDDTTHVFMQDNINTFADMIEDHAPLVGYNSSRFDVPLLAAHGITIPHNDSYDLLDAIKQAIGLDIYDHPRGYSLDAMAMANISYGKCGDGAEAPVLYQRGEIGQLIDYCLWDVHLLTRLMSLVCARGELIDPTTGHMIQIDPPFVSPAPPDELSTWAKV